ncbi:MAG: pyridoxamine 5'-phosphate oxidase family protein [Micrococcales bacterium]|nr:pyridoxamine 5'-phosphate oxidase family protein [Micrococcales bacterium]
MSDSVSGPAVHDSSDPSTSTHDPAADSDATVEKVVEMLRDSRFSMVTSIGGQGALMARPMTIQRVEDCGDLWFFINRSHDQAQAVAADSRVNVAVSSDSSWVSVAGDAQVVRDQARIDDLWNPFVDAWFPNGKDDPDVGLLLVRSDSAEYWDSPGGRVASLISFVKTKATGQPYEGGNESAELPDGSV